MKKKGACKSKEELPKFQPRSRSAEIVSPSSSEETRADDRSNNKTVVFKLDSAKLVMNVVELRRLTSKSPSTLHNGESPAQWNWELTVPTNSKLWPWLVREPEEAAVRKAWSFWDTSKSNQ